MYNDSNLLSPNSHCEVLERQTFNSLGDITVAGLTQNNRVGNAQKVANSRLNNSTNLGLLAGSVAAVAGSGQIGPCSGDSTTVYDMAVGIVVNDALGNPFTSSLGAASGKVVYAHGTGTVISSDIYETADTNGNPISYNPGDKLYSSQNGLLTNLAGMNAAHQTSIATGAGAETCTVVAVLLLVPTPAAPYMTYQVKI